ncbi:MAG: galactokinase [Verrucomicrobia bacterium]|nr:galactokinase [Verrucomicrobiota bacterium]
MTEATVSLFHNKYGAAPEQMAFAPGRIEFIGNHTDYNGGLVMGAAVTEGITLAVRRREDQQLRFTSDGMDAAEADLGNISPLTGKASWANYPLGVIKALLESGMSMPVGCEIAVTSTLPSGAGMSSSAAFELSTAYALAALYGFESDKAGFARIGRKAENEFVGMPCGILDQGVSAFGQHNALVSIDCASEVYRNEAMPKGTHFWIFDSNEKHALVDSAYADRHRECHEALALLQQQHPQAKTLSDLTCEQVKGQSAELGDLLTRRALHITGENARVRAVEAALKSGDLLAVGAALYASHESSRVNFENSTPALDALVQELAKQPEVYGARLTGGGFGGAVMAFTSADFNAEAAASVATAYQATCSREATVIHTRAGDGARLLSV